MKTVLFLLAVWCCLGLAQFVTAPSQSVATQPKAKVILPKAATASAIGTSQPPLGMPISALDVF